MSEQMSAAEIVDALVAKGVPRERAEVVAHANLGTTLPNAVTAAARPPVALPVRITLPWSALCPDNERKSPYVQMVDGRPHARMKMTARYKAARDKVVTAATRVMQDAAPLDAPLAILARVYVPTQRRVDVSNFEKGVHDALNTIVFTDDQWLWDVRWVRAGADVDAPRVEIEINLLANAL